MMKNSHILFRGILVHQVEKENEDFLERRFVFSSRISRISRISRFIALINSAISATHRFSVRIWMKLRMINKYNLNSSHEAVDQSMLSKNTCWKNRVKIHVVIVSGPTRWPRRAGLRWWTRTSCKFVFCLVCFFVSLYVYCSFKLEIFILSLYKLILIMISVNFDFRD